MRPLPLLAAAGILALLLALALSRPARTAHGPETGDRPEASPPPVGTHADPANGADPGAGTGADTASNRRLPTRRDPPSPEPPPAPSWISRIRTNGVLDVRRKEDDPDYWRLVQRHLKLRSLLASPARDTAEMRAVVDLTERHGLPLAAAPDLYQLLWELRRSERRLQAEPSAARRDAVSVVQTIETDDFGRRFERDFGAPIGPVLGELLQLPLEPQVFFGPPDVGMVQGETLLVE